MSEAVQKNLELTVKDLEYLKARGFLTEQEIRDLTVQRMDFEYKWNGQGKSVNVLTSYIQFETKILSIILHRRQELEPTPTLDHIEYALMSKISGLYVLGLERFPDDVEFGLQYFGFCWETQKHVEAKQILRSLLQRFPHVSEVYHVSFNYLAYDCHEFEPASKILHKGLAHIKDCPKLWMDLFGFEITKEIGENYIKPEPNAQLTEKEQTLLSKLTVVMLEVTAAVKDPQFYIRLLNRIEIYDCLLPVQQDIVHFLRSSCGGSAQVWKRLAQRESKGIPVDMPRTDKPRRMTQEERMVACSNMFKEGLDKVQVKNCRELCEFYIEFMIGLNDDEATQKLKAQLVSEALEISQMRGFIFEKYKPLWRKMLSFTKQTGLVEKALQECPDDENIWNLYFSKLLIERDEKRIQAEFERGVVILKDKGYQLWAQMIRYAMLTATDAFLENLYLRGIKEPGEVGMKLKPKYLKWLGMKKGIHSARIFYYSVVLDVPHIKELHEAMSILEACELMPDFQKWHKVHKLQCAQFGKNDYNVWAQLIKLYHFQESVTKIDIRKDVQEILAEAHATLPTALYTLLEEDYNNYVTAKSQNDDSEQTEKLHIPDTMFDMFGNHLSWRDRAQLNKNAEVHEID